MPVTTPVDAPIVATAVLLLLQVAPTLLVNVLVLPSHTLSVPPIAAGAGSTVTAVVVTQVDAGSV
jgi:hypothetical protein